MNNGSKPITGCFGYRITRDGTVYSPEGGRLEHQFKHQDGRTYGPYVRIRMTNGTFTMRKVDKLVEEAFAKPKLDRHLLGRMRRWAILNAASDDFSIGILAGQLVGKLGLKYADAVELLGAIGIMCCEER